MPTVLRIGPYRFYFYSNEGSEPPHIHVDSQSSSMKVWLSPISVARNIGFSAKEMNVILKHVKKHQDELVGAWNGYFRNKH